MLKNFLKIFQKTFVFLIITGILFSNVPYNTLSSIIDSYEKTSGVVDRMWRLEQNHDSSIVDKFASARDIADRFRIHGAMAAANYQGVGTWTAGTTALTVPWPTHAVNDVALLFVENANSPITLSTPAGFTEITSSPMSTGTLNTAGGVRLGVYWARATSTTMASPVVAAASNHQTARIITFRGVVETGNPWDATPTVTVKSTASTTNTFPSITTTVANDVIVLAAALDLDANSTTTSSAWTNANLTGITERNDQTILTGVGGGLAIATGLKATIGATSTSTATVTSTISLLMTIALKPQLTTTLSNLVTAEPGNATIAPAGSSAVDSFGLMTSVGTDTITAATVSLATGMGQYVQTVAITNDAGGTTYCSVAPSGDTATLTGCTIPVTTTNTQFDIKITADPEASLPAPPGGSYGVTATITGWTGTYTTHAGTDSGSSTVTIDNASPGNVTSSTATAGNTVVNLAWTNPADSDFTTGGSVVILRRQGSAVSDVPAEATTYTVGNTIGTATVACVVATPTATCQNTGLTNGQVYYYKIFTKDSRGNYDVGVVPTGSPVTPAVAPTVTTQAASSITTTTAIGNGNITNDGGSSNTKRGFVYDTVTKTLPGNVAPGSSGYLSFVEDTGSFGTGAFTKILTGLSVGSTYYVRAYSYNSAGYSYGGEVNFNVVPCSATASGLWSVGSNWTACSGVGGIPADGDSPLINSGIIITLDTNTAVLDSLAINGTLTTINSGTSYTINANSINIGATGTLNANASVINLSGISGTAFTKNASGVFNSGTSTVNMVGGSGWTERTFVNSSWQNIASSSDGKKIIASTYGDYLYTSNNSGVSWVAQTASGSRQWTGGVASSSDGTKLAAAVGGGGYIYTSNDSGVSWTERTTSGLHPWTGLASSSDGTKLVAVANGDYIYTSSDSGATWVQQANSGSRGWYDVASSSDGTKLVAVVLGSYIYTSTDSGVNWTQRTSSGMGSWIRVSSSSDGTKIIAGTSGGYIWVSTDSGSSWNSKTSVGSHSWYGVDLSPDGTKLAAAANGDYIYTSTDSGVSWTTHSSYGALTWIGVVLSSDGSKLTAINNGGHIYTYSAPQDAVISSGSPSFYNLTISGAGTRTLGEALTVNNTITVSGGTLDTTSGNNYTINTGKVLINGGTFTPNASTVNLTGTSGTLFTKSSGTFNSGSSTVNLKGGQDWTQQTSSGSRTWWNIASSSDGTKLAAEANNGYIYTSTDSGVTWTARTWVPAIGWKGIASSDDGTKLIAVANGGYIYASTDSGVTWTERTIAGSLGWRGVASSSDGTKLVAIVNNGYIYTSTDSGVNWTQQINSGSRKWYGIASSSDGTKLVASVGTAGMGYIYTSTDSGVNWTERTNAGSRYWQGTASSSDGTKLVAADNGGYIYTSTDSGVNWTQQVNSGSQSWYNVASSSDGTKLAGAVYNNYINTSSDSGVTWSAQTSSGMHIWYGISSSSDGTKLAAVDFNPGYIYTYSAPQNVIISSGSPSFNNLTISDTGTRSLGENLIVGGVLTITGGTLDTTSANSYTIDTGSVLINGGTFTLNASTINLTGSSGTLFTKSSGTFVPNNSTINLTGSGGTLSTGVAAFNNLTFSGTGTKTLGEATVINGTFTNGSGVTINTGNQPITFAGDFINNGVALNAGSSAVTITGTDNQNIAGYTTTGLTSITKTTNSGSNKYATWNPLDLGSNITLSNGNLTASGNASVFNSVRATVGKSSGKWYWETTASTYPIQGIGIGAISSSLDAWPGNDPHSWGYWEDGNVYNNGSVTMNLTAPSSNDVLGFALDMDAGTLKLYKNNVLKGTMASGLIGTYYPMWGADEGAASSTANFGATAFVYAPPSGYNAGIYNNDTVTFKGNVNGGNLTINGVGGTIDLGRSLSHVFTGTTTITNGLLNSGDSIFSTGNLLINGGTFNPGNSDINLTGTSGTLFTKSSGTFNNAGNFIINLTGNGNAIVASGSTAFGNLTVSGSGIKSLGEDLTVYGTLAVTSGTLDTTTNNYTIMADPVIVNGGELKMNASTINLTGYGTVFRYTSGIITPGTSTIKLTNASSSPKNFYGGGKVYNNIWLASGTGTGSFWIDGSNTFNDFKDTGTAAHSILFTTGSTQTFSSWNVSGTAGNLITINSTDTGTHNLVMSNGGFADVDYLNVQHSVATPASTWYAGTHSVNNQAVVTAGSGWVFTIKPVLNSTYTLSGFRLFNNVNDYDVGSALSVLNTSASLSKSGDAFRLRTLLHIGTGALSVGAQNFKLQYSQKSGTCDTSFTGENYLDVTSNTDIAYYDNFYPVNAVALTSNANDPIHSSDTIVNQSYIESNNFTSIALIPLGQDGKWDMSLYDKSVSSGTSYCIRVVKSDGSLLDIYTYIPEITTAIYRSRGGGGGNVESGATPNAPVTGGGESGGGGNTTLPQCSDTIDNDADTLIDAADPNCHVGGILGNEYIPSHNSETTSPVVNTGGGSGGGQGQGDLGYLFKKIYSAVSSPFTLSKNFLLALALNSF